MNEFYNGSDQHHTLPDVFIVVFQHQIVPRDFKFQQEISQHPCWSIIRNAGALAAREYNTKLAFCLGC